MLSGVVEGGSFPGEKEHQDRVSNRRAAENFWRENVPFVASAHVGFVLQEQAAHFHLPVSNGAPQRGGYPNRTAYQLRISEKNAEIGEEGRCLPPIVGCVHVSFVQQQQPAHVQQLLPIDASFVDGAEQRAGSSDNY